MSTKAAQQPDELRMKSDDFDRMMRGALGVPAPAAEVKVKAQPKKRAAAKKTPKKA